MWLVVVEHHSSLQSGEIERNRIFHSKFSVFVGDSSECGLEMARFDFLLVLAVVVLAWSLPRYWIYIPAILDMILYPDVIQNQPVFWKKSNKQIPNKENHPNIVVILADDLGK